jgi:hypothetical protein
MSKYRYPEYLKRWKKLHPHYNRDLQRQRRGWIPPGGVMLLGVRVDLRAVAKARATVEFLALTEGMR